MTAPLPASPTTDPASPDLAQTTTATGAAKEPGGSAPSATALSPAQLRLLVIAGGVLLVGWLVSALSGALAPFLAAALLAYACDPLVDKLEARGISRSIGSALVIVFLVLLFLGCLLTVVPLFVELSGRIATRLPGLLARIEADLLPWLQARFGISVSFDLPHLTAFAEQHAATLQALGTRLLSSLSDGGKVLIQLAVMVVLVPVVLYYLLVDWDRLIARLNALVPPRWTIQTNAFTNEIDQVLGQFLRGQLSVMLILATYYALALSIAGVEFALPVGLLTGLLIFIPYLGFSLGFLLALTTAALQGAGWEPIIAVLGIYGVGQAIESFLLTPWLVGERIGLHPVAVIFALLAFGQLFGLVGMLLALPAAAVILVALRTAHRRYLDSRFYQEQ